MKHFNRRIRESVTNVTEAMGFSDVEVVLAGLSNVYTQYVTTYEEYQAQRYEGASTIFGPNSLQAYQNQYTSLIERLLQVLMS